jgi:nucleoside-diphosphate-sugar epimerase
MFEGLFREDMFEEAEGLDHPYFKTKHDSEGIVRRECSIPWRIYRPAIVVGDSRTGEMDKIDGPYYFFKLIQKMRKMLPTWMPTIGIEGGRINVVPVDFVVKAVDHIAHLKGEDGKCFHLVDPTPMRVGDLLNTFARAAHAPEMTMRINAALFSFIPHHIRKALMALSPIRRIQHAVMADLGLPPDMLRFVNYPTRFDCRETTRVLKGTGITVPPLEDYAWRLWDYWERHLDPDLFIDRSLRGQVGGKVVLVTGASSGIGKATAWKLAEAGANVVTIARDKEQLDEVVKAFEAAGLKLHAYVGDLADMASTEAVVQQIIGRTWRGRCPDQQRRSFHSSGHRKLLRSFPRFRADDAAQLFRRPQGQHGCPAENAGTEARPYHQYFLDWRTDQCAAFFGLCRVKGCARCLGALCRFGVRRSRYFLHDDQHAAGQDANDCADQNLRSGANPDAGRSCRTGL